MDQPRTWLQNCTNHTYQADRNDYRCQTIHYAKVISASLSILGCFLVLFVIILYKKYTQFNQRLVMYLIIPTFVISGVALNPNMSGDACIIAGFLMNWGILSQRFLILCIVINLLVYSFRERRPWYLELAFHGIIWIFSFCLSVIPLFGNHYGSVGVWCWILGNSNFELNDLRIICTYMWVWVCVVIEIACFSCVVIRILKQFRRFKTNGLNDDPIFEEHKIRFRKYIFPLMLYPLVNILLAIPVTVNRAQNMINPGHPIFALFVIHSTIYPIWGFCNTMMYFMNKDTIQQLHFSAIMKQVKSYSSKPDLTNSVQVDVGHAQHVISHSRDIQTSEEDME